MRLAAPLALATLLASTSLASAEVKVMASIKPIHSLVASVMEGVGTPGLIVDGSNSPHNYSMKPTDAAALEQAQVIFWVGHELEAFLEKPLEALGSKAKSVSLIDSEGIKTMPPREGNGFDAHEEHGAEEEAGHDHDHGEEVDAHVWLDPSNAKVMLSAIANTLSEVDAANATTYKANAEKTAAKLDALTTEIEGSIAPAKGKGYIVFHDAYHYFEKRFGVSASGAISIHPENPPGAKGIAEIRQRIADGKVACVFAEPQFDNKLVNVILEGSSVKAATLDPIGATLEPGPALYETLLRDLSQSLVQCLR